MTSACLDWFVSCDMHVVTGVVCHVMQECGGGERPEAQAGQVQGSRVDVAG